MASSRSRSLQVFPSFRGEDVRRTFLSHLIGALDRKLVRTVFKDSYIERGHSISPALVQERFLSESLDQKDVKIDHLGVLGGRLNDHKVPIVLDDVDDGLLLDALVGQTLWFGFGSRIIVITKDVHLLRSHGIERVYEVGFPSEDQALESF